MGARIRVRLALACNGVAFEPRLVSLPMMGHRRAEYPAKFGPEHAKTVAGDGYGLADVKRFLHEHGTLPMGKFSQENIERRLRVTFKERYANAGPDTPVPIVQTPDDILVAVVGGAGKHSAVIPTFGATRAATRALKRGDGQLAKSMQDFRRA